MVERAASVQAAAVVPRTSRATGLFTQRRGGRIALHIIAVLLGIILGPGAVPGIGFLDGSVLRSLAPVTALAIGWIGAGLGARFEWRSVRRISRRAWLLAALPSGAAFGAVALGAWMLTRALPAVAAAWTPRLAAILMLAAVAAVSGPGVVALVAREAGLRRSTARGLVLAASSPAWRSLSAEASADSGDDPSSSPCSV